MALHTDYMEKVLDRGEESTFSTGHSPDGWMSTICALRHRSGEPSAYYVDVFPIKDKKGKNTGKQRVSVKKVTKHCDERHVYGGVLKNSEFHSNNIPDTDDGPNYIAFGRYILLMSADNSWVLGIAKP